MHSLGPIQSKRSITQMTPCTPRMHDKRDGINVEIFILAGPPLFNGKMLSVSLSMILRPSSVLLFLKSSNYSLTEPICRRMIIFKYNFCKFGVVGFKAASLAIQRSSPYGTFDMRGATHAIIDESLRFDEYRYTTRLDTLNRDHNQRLGTLFRV